MRITVAGMGYVGLSNAVLLAQHNTVTALDIIQEKVDLINNGKSPLADKDIELFIAEKKLNLQATTDSYTACKAADMVIIATPTDYDPEKKYFNTETVEAIVDKVLSINSSALIIVRSTVPVGYTENLKKLYNTENIIFCPEFLREGTALYDNLYPSRIVIGENSQRAGVFAELLKEGAVKKDIDVLYTNSSEAEAIKLFANTYLAMRIAFFNELDTYAEVRELDTTQIIRGICLDPRIGAQYNNPSFGYGGYCLPKDTRQLLANYRDVPQNIMTAVVDANITRKEHIAEMIKRRNPTVAGIYRLTMKTGADNFRQSSVLDIICLLQKGGIEVVVYEPSLKEENFNNCRVIKDLAEFKSISDVIVANRMSDNLRDVNQKIYTRDLFGRD